VQLAIGGDVAVEIYFELPGLTKRRNFSNGKYCSMATAISRCRRLVLTLLVPLAGSAVASSLRLITFDLDDTLWPTGAVVHAVNAALADSLGAYPIDIQTRLYEARSSGTPPPSYSEARIRAIEGWLCEREDAPASCRAEAELRFELWLTERHSAASRLLFAGAAAAVAETRRLHPDAAIGAITNGRGDPLAMPELASYFDFTVSAEDTEIYPKRKPAKEPFLAALRLAGCEPVPTQWAHVGDDLINDVQAARNLGAWSVWLDQPPSDAGSHEAQPGASPDDAIDSSFWYSTMSEEERAARRAQAKQARTAASATIYSISELPAVLQLAPCYEPGCSSSGSASTSSGHR